MSTSAPPVRDSATAATNDADSDDDPSEIAESDLDTSDPEEEVEEEVEEDDIEEVELVEEEVEEEEVEEEEEETPQNADEDNKDFNGDMGSEGQDGNFRPGSSPENAKLMLPSNALIMGETSGIPRLSGLSNEQLAMEKVNMHMNNETSNSLKSGKHLVTSELDRSQGLEVDKENARSFLDSKKSSGEHSHSHVDSKAHIYDGKVMKTETTNPFDDIGKEVAATSLERAGSVEETNGDQNSSVRIRLMELQKGDDIKRKASRSNAPDLSTRSLSPRTEISNGNKRPAAICDFFAKGWCIRGSSCRFLHIKDHVNNTGRKAEGDLAGAKGKTEAQLDEGLEDNSEGPVMPDHADPLTSVFGSTSAYLCKPPAERAVHWEQEGQVWHPFHEKQKFPLLQKEDLSFGNHAPAISRGSSSSIDSLFPEYSMSNALGNHYSTNLSSHSTCQEGLTNTRGQHINNIGERIYPCFLHQEFHCIQLNIDQKSLQMIGNLLNLSDPHFLLLLQVYHPPGSQYNPLRDSIEIPNIGDGSLKVYFYNQGSPIQASSHMRIFGESALSGNQAADNDNKSSVSSHDRFSENVVDKACFPCERDFIATETETTAGTSGECQNRTVAMGGTQLDLKDFTKTNKQSIEPNGRDQIDGSIHKKDLKVDRDIIDNEMDVDCKLEGNVQKELKILRPFRAALIELVKELLKPTWREGNLSKEAHNVIVRKSVDKVLCTLQPHQFPCTTDNVKHYLSSSRSKITKLVEGYVDKYGKS
ncbi:Zinc finger CCCH domain-containing protein 27-like [Quillaja saponaria]|uniref:Zinc finger CCCH domain-containing protein 27-like n=1 Tax=Quillaja saponaria TaxID=32244 RepID=A0AAD7PV69_QUISA|nr:Zinc finger CCCH domain-containing protein 27-like [Quillaja saponaria]